MAWSFLWRWVAAAAVLCPLSFFGFAFGIAAVHGIDALTTNEQGAVAGGKLVILIVLASTAIWAFFAARRLKR